MSYEIPSYAVKIKTVITTSISILVVCSEENPAIQSQRNYCKVIQLTKNNRQEMPCVMVKTFTRVNKEYVFFSQ